MLACFLMVLGQLPLREIAPKPKTEPNTSLGAIIWILFLTIVAYFSSPLKLQYKIYFQKGSVHILHNLRTGRQGFSKILKHNYGRGGGGWPYDMRK